MDAFLLTRQWRDTPDGIELVYWGASEAGPIRIQFDRQEAVCFIAREASIPSSLVPESTYRQQNLDLSTLDGDPVDGLYFTTQRGMVGAVSRLKGSGLRVYESDIKPTERHLMERFVTGPMHVAGAARRRGGFLEFFGPKMTSANYRPSLSVLSLDIETEDFDGRLYTLSVTEGDSGTGFRRREPRLE